MAATDSSGAMSVALVTRDVGQGGGVGVVAPRVDNGTEFDIYTAGPIGNWTKRQTLVLTTVGNTAGRPDIATDGLGWAVTWQRALPSGRYEVVAAVTASVNAEPSVSVLSSSYPDGYVGGPDPRVDAAPNDAIVGGARYLVAWMGRLRAPGAAAPSSTTIETREMFVGRQWGALTTLATYGAASTISDLKVAYADDRSAAVGYVNRVVNDRSLTVASRLASGAWSAPAPVINEPSSKTTGVWALDDIHSGQSVVPMAWAVPNPLGVRYARMTLGHNAANPERFHRRGAHVAAIAITSRPNDNVVLLWTEQDAVSPVAVQEVRLLSYVTTFGITQPVQQASTTVYVGQSSGSPVVNAAMNEMGRTWVTLTTAGPAPTAAIRVFEAPSAAPSRVWSQATSTPTTLTGAVPGSLIRGTGLLLSGDFSIYPRVVWAMGAGDPFSFMATQEQAGGQPPSAPLNVTARPGDATALVLWDAPADQGTTPVFRYTVTANPGGATCTTEQRECIVVGLTNDTTYTFTVVARNAAGEGVASAPSAAVTPTAAPAAGPLPPAGFTVKAKPGRKVVVKWTASPSDAVTSYVLGTQKNAGAWRDRNVGDVLRRTYTVKLNKTFCYRVAAVAAG
ncbi:MAG: fibronectin type III domain-containing protein, partial [Ilumatobacteraceae bacterium]